MSVIKRIFILSLFVLTTGCSIPGLESVGLPVALSPGQGSSASTVLVQLPLNQRPTATPFQPLPPTAVYYPTDVPTPIPSLTPTPLPTPFPQNPEAAVGLLPLPPDQMNILLLGSDARPWNRVFRTDVIILLTLAPSKGVVSMISFPRDLWVTIPGVGANRINTAWQNGGFSKLAATFEHNFGVKPTNYVLINFSSFKSVIDSLGGLDVNVAETVSDYRAGRYVTIKQGRQYMDADLVLWYVRTRKTTSDFARNRRQQEIIIAIFEKMLSMNAIKRAPEFYQIYKDNVTTSMSLIDMLPLLPLAASLTDGSLINHYYVKGKQVTSWVTPTGAQVLLPNRDRIMNVIKKAMVGQK
ncbi:MAG: LCP family protein [Anaerolineales bacterium]|nr:LCP family protein [Anaerolineales bacterium]